VGSGERGSDREGSVTVVWDGNKKPQGLWTSMAESAATIQKCPSASSSIFVRVCEKKGCSADRCVEVARRERVPRNETDSRIEGASCQAKQGVLPFCRIASGIASIRRRDNCLRQGQKPSAGKHKCDENETIS